MIRNDFLLRQIEQFGAFLRKLLSAREAGIAAAEVQSLLEGECLTFTGLTLEALSETPAEALVSRFLMNANQAPGRLYAAGRVLAEVAELDLLDGNLLRARERYLDAVRLVAFGAAQVEDEEARELFVTALEDLNGRGHRFPLDDAGESEIAELVGRFVS